VPFLLCYITTNLSSSSCRYRQLFSSQYTREIFLGNNSISYWEMLPLEPFHSNSFFGDSSHLVLSRGVKQGLIPSRRALGSQTKRLITVLRAGCVSSRSSQTGATTSSARPTGSYFIAVPSIASSIFALSIASSCITPHHNHPSGGTIFHEE
jgi:hypothetical protein